LITLYGIGNCDKVRKTRNWLAAQQLEYDFHDYKKSGCDLALAKRLLDAFSVQEVINTRGTTWRKLEQGQREPLDEPRALQLMQDYPSLIKRPILHIGQSWLLSHEPERITALINEQQET